MGLLEYIRLEDGAGPKAVHPPTDQILVDLPLLPADERIEIPGGSRALGELVPRGLLGGVSPQGIILLGWTIDKQPARSCAGSRADDNGSEARGSAPERPRDHGKRFQPWAAGDKLHRPGRGKGRYRIRRRLLTTPCRATTSWFRLLLFQRKGEERVSGRDRHVLLAPHLIRDGRVGHAPAEVLPPQQLAIVDVQRHEVAFHAA